MGSAHLLFLPIGMRSPDNMAPIFLWEATFSPTHSPQATCVASAPSHSDWFRVTRVLASSGYSNNITVGWGV